MRWFHVGSFEREVKAWEADMERRYPGLWSRLNRDEIVVRLRLWR